MGQKHGLGIDVFTAAKQRLSRIFDDFQKVYLSFSGGKDSTVLLHMCVDEARRRKRTFGLLFIDLEAQYKLTIEHVTRCFADYSDCCEPFWVALPLSLRNAVSNFEPQWTCWEEGRESEWIRNPPPHAITSTERFPWFTTGMEFEDLVEDFGKWYSEGMSTACLVGIRSDESLNRYRSVTSRSMNFEGLQWTTYKSGTLFNAYPIYDWRTSDIWIYHAKQDRPYNRLYDRMHQAGLTIHQARICQPYGDDQRKGLWLYQVIEPDTWARVVARVNGANQGALYSKEAGNVLGQYKVSKPPNHTWESFARMLLSTLPDQTRTHYEDKIAVFLKWYADRGYPNGIPDEGAANDKTSPSWTRICKVLLRNDYWCKGLSFSQHKSGAYEKYRKIMEKRRAQWKII